MSCKENQNWGTRNKRMVENRNGYGKRKPVLQYDLDGNFIKEWKSIIDAERELEYKKSHISQCCKGKIKTSHGYIWRYRDE